MRVQAFPQTDHRKVLALCCSGNLCNFGSGPMCVLAHKKIQTRASTTFPTLWRRAEASVRGACRKGTHCSQPPTQLDEPDLRACGDAARTRHRNLCLCPSPCLVHPVGRKLGRWTRDSGQSRSGGGQPRKVRDQALCCPDCKRPLWRCQPARAVGQLQYRVASCGKEHLNLVPQVHVRQRPSCSPHTPS